MDDQDKEAAAKYIAQGGDEEVARAASILLRISRDARAARYRFPDDNTVGGADQEDRVVVTSKSNPPQQLARTRQDTKLLNRLSTMPVKIENAKIASDMLDKLNVLSGKDVENLKLRVVQDYTDLGIIVDGNLLNPPYARVSSLCLFKRVDHQDSGKGFRLEASDVEKKFYGFMTQREKNQAETGPGIDLDAYCAANSKLYKGIKLAKLSSGAFVLTSDAWTRFWKDNIIKAKSDGITMWFLRDQTNKLSLFLSPTRVTGRRSAIYIQP